MQRKELNEATRGYTIHIGKAIYRIQGKYPGFIRKIKYLQEKTIDFYFNYLQSEKSKCFLHFANFLLAQSSLKFSFLIVISTILGLALMDCCMDASL